MPISSAASFFTPPALSSARRIVSRSDPFDVLPQLAATAGPRLRRRRAEHESRAVTDASSGRQDDGALDGVLELADVAGPVVLLQRRQHAVVDAVDPPAGTLGVLPDEVLDQRRDVFAPIAQRRDLDRNDVEPVEQVVLELGLRRPSAAGRDWSPR